MKFKEINFSPTEEHYRMLSLSLFLMKNSLNDYKIYKEYISIWVDFLEKEKLNALYYMIETFDLEADDETKNIEKSDGLNRNELIIIRVCAWWTIKIIKEARTSLN